MSENIKELIMKPIFVLPEPCFDILPSNPTSMDDI